MDNNKSWIDQRFPLTKVWNEHLAEYYTPRNFNFWYFFGSLAILVLVIQLITGIFLTMHYKPEASLAFNSVEFIMRDVDWGWLIRYMHSTGASAFFVVIYLHMYRALIYGSYKAPILPYRWLCSKSNRIQYERNHPFTHLVLRSAEKPMARSYV